MSIWRKHLALCVLLLAVGPAFAGPYEAGETAFQNEDYPLALSLWEPLAKQGDPAAQSKLGHMYHWGIGVSRDTQKSIKWYRMAAKQGYTDAQVFLGIVYHAGLGVPQDYLEGINWLSLAAAQGDSVAQLCLGRVYSKGEGVPQDYIMAHMWLNLAAARGNEHARTERDFVSEKMTAAQVAEAQRLAREWKPAPEKP